MKTKLQKDFIRIFLALFIVLVIIWVSFYILAMHLLVRANEQLLTTISNELLEDLSENIQLMEQINYTISHKTEIVEFLSEQNLDKRHSFASQIHAVLLNEILTIDNRFSMVIFDDSGWFYRFLGSITVTECERLAVLTEGDVLDDHFSVTLDGEKHIGYKSDIFDAKNNFIGTVFVLENELNFLEYFYDSTDDYAVSAAILSGDEVISANAPYIGEDAQLFTKRQAGITPFQVATWLSPNYDNTLNQFFLIGVTLSTLLMILTLLWFVRKQRKTFVAPLVHVMTQADKVGDDGGRRLDFIGSEDFDNLILKINDLLTRIENQNEVVKTSLLEAEHSKIEVQEAINILLKKQINAHFIVNTLSAIQSLLKQNDTIKSELALANLSDIVRYAFDEDNYISVWDELMYLQKYIDIMNIRHCGKIKFEMEADDNLMDYMVPRMIIQPIIENSIAHGFAFRESDCLLTINAKRCEGGVIISVADNGCGMSEDVLTEMNKKLLNYNKNIGMDRLDKMAINNVKRRLYNDSVLSDFHASSSVGVGSLTTITIIRGKI